MYEEGATRITEELSYQVQVIYRALTGIESTVRGQERTSQNKVITDYGLLLHGRVKILWENKSAKAFNKFIGPLSDRMKDGPATLCTEPKQKKYDGYKAIMAKVRVCLCQASPV